jgi:CubicO group peptidase (beta-lactamase class C family)
VPRLAAVVAAFLFASLALAQEDISAWIESERARLKLPGLAIHVFRGDRTLAVGAAGVRKHGSAAPLRITDRFHIGSCTKAMTATIAGLLVEQGKLRWNSTLAEVLPDLSARMHPAYRTVTLEMLFAHRSGAPANTRVKQAGSLMAQRIEYALDIVSRPPQHGPGSTYLYSNAGYIVAGAMIERASGRQWEDLMRELLFKPLGMTSCGFGVMASNEAGEADAPWGHQRDGAGFIPHNIDNPPYLGPAGTVHCALQDYARFARAHMRRAQVLKRETFDYIQTSPRGQEYALGWLVVHREWAGGHALTHAGSNTVNRFVAWLAPRRDFGVLAATNLGRLENDDTVLALDQVVWALIQKYN